MEKQLMSDAAIIAEIRHKYEYYSKWANKYKAMLDAAQNEGLFVVVSGAAKMNGNSNELLVVTHHGRRKETFADTIVKYFADNKPKTTMMLLAMYNQQTNKPLDRRNFSSRLSIMAKLTRRIKNIEYEDASNDTRFWWGLSEWFAGDYLKPEFASQVLITKKGAKLFQ